MNYIPVEKRCVQASPNDPDKIQIPQVHRRAQLELKCRSGMSGSIDETTFELGGTNKSPSLKENQAQHREEKLRARIKSPRYMY
jgi:hypothetical protein